MTHFDFKSSPLPIREDLASAYRAAWIHLASPGTWLTGAQRIAVAGASRDARACPLCRDRKSALSPASVNGIHHTTETLRETLPESWIDAIHRFTTDAARLSKSFYTSLVDTDMQPEEYVEILGATVITISIDRFHDALGLDLEPLPMPREGQPTRKRESTASVSEAWVPMLGAKPTSAAIGLPGMPAPFVIRALSAVPAEVRAWRAVSAAQYLGEKEMMHFESTRAASRSQIELVAGRVSALNECFY